MQIDWCRLILEVAKMKGIPAQGLLSPTHFQAASGSYQICLIWPFENVFLPTYNRLLNQLAMETLNVMVSLLGYIQFPNRNLHSFQWDLQRIH